MKLIGLHFKTKDYAKFVNVLKNSGGERAALVGKMKNISHKCLAKIAIYSHLLVQGFQNELLELESSFAVKIFDYLVFNTDKNIFKDELFITYLIGRVNSADLIVMNLLESIRPSIFDSREIASNLRVIT